MAAPVIAAVGAVATGSNSTVGASASLTPAVPASVASGDLIVVAVTVEWQASGTDAAGTTSSVSVTGFTQAAFYSVKTSDSWGAEGSYLFYKHATGADTGTYAVTVSAASTMSVYSASATAARITGAATSGNPFWTTFSEYAPGGQGTSFPVPAFTPPQDNCLLIGFGQFSNNTSVTIPSGWTSKAYSSHGISLSSLTQSTAASTGTLTWSVPGNDYPAIIVATVLPVAVPVAGSAAVTMPKPVVAASGVDTGYNTGGGAVALPKPTVSATGAQTDAGSASATLPKPTAHANTPFPVVTGALNLASAATGQARVLFLGDSVLEGEGASTRANRGSAKLVSEFRSRKGIAGNGSGMLLHFQATSLSDSSAWRSPLDASSQIANTGWFSTQGHRGADYDAMGDYAEWTVQGTSVDFVSMHGYGGGSFSVSVDGGAATVIDTSPGSPSSSVATRISLGASGSHTVRSTLTAGGGGTADGLVVYDGDEATGITWWDCTHGGYSSQDFANTGAVDYRGGWTAFDPHLIVDNSTGIGDYNGSNTLSQFASNLTARLNVYAALPSTPDVILLLTYKLPSQVTNTNSVGLTVQNYYDQAASIAASYPNVTVLDLNAVYPNFASTSGWLASDNGHPSDLGHQAIADAVANAILGPPSVSGTAAATLGKPSASASATITITGTSAVTVAGPQASASAIQTDTGSAVATVQAPSVAASGQLLLSGTATATFPAPTASASATQSDSGSAGVTLPPFTVSAQDVPIISGTVDVTLGAPTASAAGTQTVTGTVTIHPASATVSADGQVTVTGAAHVTIPVPDVNATGIQTGPVLGTAQVVLPQALVAAIGAQTVTGSVAVHLPVPGVFTSSFAAQPWPNLWSVSVLGGFITMSADAPISLTAIT